MNRNLFSYTLIKFLVLITAFQFSAFGIEDTIYVILRYSIISTIVLLFSINLKRTVNNFRRFSLLKTHAIVLLVLAPIIIAFIPFRDGLPIGPIRDLALALIVISIGVSINLNEIQYNKLVNIYIVSYALAALSIVYTYASGFVIQESYFPIPKNQIAPAFGTAFLLALYFSFKSRGSKKVFYYVFGFLLMSSLLVIRGRAVIVAVFIAVTIFILSFIPSRKYKILTILIGIALLPFVGQFIYEALFLNYNTSDINSISTGRIVSYIEGIEYLKNHWIGVFLESSSYKGDTIHNYILYNLVNYGVFISSFLIIIYLKYVYTIFLAIRKNNFQYYEVGPLVLVIIFIVSLFEYTYPYAPGSAIFFPFFLMGQYLKNEYTPNQNIS